MMKAMISSFGFLPVTFYLKILEKKSLKSQSEFIDDKGYCQKQTNPKRKNKEASKKVMESDLIVLDKSKNYSS